MCWWGIPPPVDDRRHRAPNGRTSGERRQRQQFASMPEKLRKPEKLEKPEKPAERKTQRGGDRGRSSSRSRRHRRDGLKPSSSSRSRRHGNSAEPSAPSLPHSSQESQLPYNGQDYMQPPRRRQVIVQPPVVPPWPLPYDVVDAEPPSSPEAPLLAEPWAVCQPGTAFSHVPHPHHAPQVRPHAGPGHTSYAQPVLASCDSAYPADSDSGYCCEYDGGAYYSGAEGFSIHGSPGSSGRDTESTPPSGPPRRQHPPPTAAAAAAPHHHTQHHPQNHHQHRRHRDPPPASMHSSALHRQHSQHSQSSQHSLPSQHSQHSQHRPADRTATKAQGRHTRQGSRSKGRGRDDRERGRATAR